MGTQEIFPGGLCWPLGGSGKPAVPSVGLPYAQNNSVWGLEHPSHFHTKTRSALRSPNGAIVSGWVAHRASWTFPQSLKTHCWSSTAVSKGFPGTDSAHHSTWELLQSPSMCPSIVALASPVCPEIWRHTASWFGGTRKWLATLTIRCTWRGFPAVPRWNGKRHSLWGG